MRRCLAVAVLATALSLPASAVAGVRYFEGSVDPAGDVYFHARFHDGQPRKVTEFTWSGVPAECDAGRTSVPGHFGFAMWVADGTFHGKGVLRNRKGTVIGLSKVTGQLQGGDQSTGTIRVSGKVPGYGTGCETTRLGWGAAAG